MTGPPNKVNPRGIRLQVLKENLELGIKFWADWGMEKELCFGCCFSLLHPERHFQTMWITTCFYQSSWDLWNGHFSFSFFFCHWQNLVFGYNVSSLQESHQTEHIQLKWKAAVLQFSVISTLWMQDSLFVYYSHLATPLHTLFIHLLATTEMQGIYIQKSCNWDGF